MSYVLTATPRARRFRNALLASVFTLGIVGLAGGGAVLTDSHLALAEQVKVEAEGPADFTAVVEKVIPAVVSVQVKTEESPVADSRFEGFENLPPGLEDFFRRFGMPRPFGDDGDDGRGRPYQPRQGISQGSGFFVSEDGYLITNSHVVRDGSEYTVTTNDGRELDAKVVGTDDRTDLALLKVEGDGFTYVAFSEAEPKVGQWVLAVGNPFGLGGSVSAGIISAEQRDIGTGPYDNYLQIDAPVNRGNSGGPVLNTKGEVVGVATAIFSPSGGSVGIAFAIPANIVSDVVSDLRDDGIVTRGWLGVQIQPVTGDIAESLGIEAAAGAIVADALTDGPAKAAGIVAGDVITKVNGQAVKNPKELSETIAGMDPGQKITVTLLRDGEEQEVSVALGDLNDFDQRQERASVDEEEQEAPVQTGSSLEDLGLVLEDNPDGDGVRVASVEEGSAAAERGIQAGNVIVEVGRQPVNSAADIEKGISDARDLGRDAVLLKVQGENGVRFVGVPFNRG
ncbi:MAG: Do family serine endopeptidase [Propylenella sp.]